MHIELALAVVVIAFLAATSLSITAFGFGLVMVPLLSLLWDVKSAVIISNLLAVTLQIPLFYGIRQQIEPSRVVPILLGSLAGIPLGIFVFTHTGSSSLQVLLASIFIITAIVFLISPQVRLARPTTLLSLLIGSCTGTLHSATGAPGPPVVLYALSFERDVNRFRSLLLPVFLPTGMFVLIGLAIVGAITKEVLVASAIALPSAALGTIAGSWLRVHISSSMFRDLALLLVMASSIAVLLAAFGVLHLSLSKS